MNGKVGRPIDDTVYLPTESIVKFSVGIWLENPITTYKSLFLMYEGHFYFEVVRLEAFSGFLLLLFLMFENLFGNFVFRLTTVFSRVF